MYKKSVYIVSTKNSAAGMRDAVKKMAPLALKIGKGEEIDPQMKKTIFRELERISLPIREFRKSCRYVTQKLR